MGHTKKKRRSKKFSENEKKNKTWNDSDVSESLPLDRRRSSWDDQLELVGALLQVGQRQGLGVAVFHGAWIEEKQ